MGNPHPRGREKKTLVFWPASDSVSRSLGFRSPFQGNSAVAPSADRPAPAGPADPERRLEVLPSMQENDGPCFGLAPIRLADRPLFHEVFSRQSRPISDYSFACTFIWSASLKIYWARRHRHLCLFANGTGDLTLLVPPLPEPGAKADDLARCLQESFSIMDDYNQRFSDRSRSRVEYVSEDVLARLRATPGFDLEASPMSVDYIYDMARMIDLAGGGLKSKRSARNKFMRDFPDHRTELLAPAHRQACLALLLRWQQRAETKYGTAPEATASTSPYVLRRREVAACEFALDHMEALNLKGMALFVGSDLIGFTLGEALTTSQASILIEKTHPDYPGAPQCIFSEFCRQYWADYPECNAGDDCGMPSLQFTKESYRPILRLNKYSLARRVPARHEGSTPLVENLPAAQMLCA